MNRFGKLAIVTFVLLAGVILVRHADTALNASIPRDMPENAKFVQSGYDVRVNEPQGQWIACLENTARASDWCRVTDEKGVIVYQGNFVSVDSAQPVSDEELIVAASDPSKIWVQGPLAEGPVPVIPLANGRVLVPVADRGALADRWASNPNEYRRITAN